MEALLGIDVGTTNIKAVLYDLGGTVLGAAAVPTPTQHEAARRAWHDPQALWRAVVSAIGQALSRAPQARVLGTCVASIGEAGVPLDAHNEPIYPIIAWYDERTTGQVRWWEQAMGSVRIYNRTGLPLGHTFSLNKIMWLRESEPQVYREMRRWLCVSDYVTFRLTGEQQMGYSLASRTMALDLRARRWSEEMIVTAAASPDLLPPLRAEGSPAGSVTKEVALVSGLAQGTPVYVGGHDHVCGALAMGIREPGMVLDSTGTTEAELTALSQVDDLLAQGNLAFCLGCHAAQDRYYATGAILGAGSMLRWLAAILWPEEAVSGAEEALAALTRAADSSPIGANGLYLLPHMAGAGSPDRAPTARGVLAGLSLGHTREDMARAALEGLAFELRVLWEALEAFTGQPIRQVLSVGGGARNALWNQIKADVTGRPLQVPDQAEAAALGAALLAGLGVGIYADEGEAIARTRTFGDRVEPRVDHAQTYAGIYERTISPLRPLCAKLGQKSGSLTE